MPRDAVSRTAHVGTVGTNGNNSSTRSINTFYLFSRINDAEMAEFVREEFCVKINLRLNFTHIFICLQQNLGKITWNRDYILFH